MRRRRQQWWRRPLAGQLLGVLVAGAVVAGGVGFWFMRPTEYEASTVLVVLPAGQSEESAGFYDTLSRGQVVQTFAQILDLQGAQSSTAGVNVGVEVVVEAVPDTSLIQVEATASDAAVAERVADAVLADSEAYFDQLSSPYDISVVREAEGTAERVGLPLIPLMTVVVAVAALSGVASYLAFRALFFGQTSLRTPTSVGEAPRDDSLTEPATRQSDVGSDQRQRERPTEVSGAQAVR